MTEKGFIICRHEHGITLNKLEYLLDDKNEIRHFDSEQEVTDFMEKFGIEKDNVMVKYHIFCMHCGKEFFFEMEEMPDEEDKVFYVCIDCKKIIEKKINNINE
jgi:DNA-directed RNA polymerase subunit RPC12/RpoP